MVFFRYEFTKLPGLIQIFSILLLFSFDQLVLKSVTFLSLFMDVFHKIQIIRIWQNV